MMQTQVVTGEADNQLEYQDDLIDSVATSDCHLAMRLDTDGFQYAVFDSHSDQCVFLKKVPRDSEQEIDLLVFFEAQLADEALLSKDYGSVSLAFAGGPALAVPAGFTEEQNAQKLLELHLGHAPSEVAEEKVEVAGLSWLYEFPGEIVKAAKSSFPNVKVSHNSAWMVQSMLRKSKWAKGRQVFVDLSDTFFDLYILSDGKLEFYNAFSAHSETDVFYHLANTLQKLGLKAEEEKILISGPVDVGGDTMKLFRKYLKNTDLNFGMDFYKLAKGLGGAKKQYFVSLLNQYVVCAS
ncbi:DUF3822 family protein [Halocola ammonii]